MASINNWLGFSLSTEEPDSYPSNSTLKPDPSFSILDAFNPPPNDWSIKNLNFKGTGASELSMIVGSSAAAPGICGTLDEVVVDQPKLEDFLGGGGHSFSGSMAPGDHYLYSNGSLQAPGIAGGGGGNGSIGLSMIKTWLRNQPAPPGTVMEGKEGGDDVGMRGRGGSSQSLALSMSTGGSQSSSAVPLVAVGMAAGGGDGGESLMLENEEKGGRSCTKIDAHSGAKEAVPRKSIDTFGQRTSIYRGVTRFGHGMHFSIAKIRKKFVIWTHFVVFFDNFGTVFVFLLLALFEC